MEISAFIAKRIAMWDQLKSEYDESVEKQDRKDIKITLKDGQVIMADNAVVAKVNGRLKDLDGPLTEDCALELLNKEDKDGQYVFWHSSAHVLGEALEPKFDDAIIDKEKINVIEERHVLQRNYREVVFDYIHATAFQGTPLSRSIIGSEENIQNATSKALLDFISDFYKAPQTTLVGVGDIEDGKLGTLAQMYLGDVSCNYGNGIVSILPCRFTASEMAAKRFHLEDPRSFQNFFLQYNHPPLWGLYYTANGHEMFEKSKK